MSAENHVVYSAAVLYNNIDKNKSYFNIFHTNLLQNYFREVQEYVKIVGRLE